MRPLPLLIILVLLIAALLYFFSTQAEVVPVGPVEAEVRQSGDAR